MSDLSLVRLRKPFSYYKKKYGTVFYGLNKLYLLLEKQHNRGQDGGGIATVKLHTEPGYPFMSRVRSVASQPIPDLYEQIFSEVEEFKKYQPGMFKYPGLMKGNIRFLGELLLAHLRYGRHSKNNIELCHPFIKHDPIPGRNLIVAGNFSLVNVPELFEYLGLNNRIMHPESGLEAVLEIFSHFINQEDNVHPEQLDLVSVLRQSASLFDGGYHMGGLIGNGDAFVLRDPFGIRPSFYYMDEDVVVASSERPAIQTAFDITVDEVKELTPGCALIIKENGSVSEEMVLEPGEKKSCSFERIYFSRGNDRSIYQERLKLGYTLSEKVLKAIDYDLRNTVFSFIPNTAEVAYYGLMKGVEHYLNEIKVQRILSWGKDFDEEKLSEMINRKVRMEKVVIKDVKMRTFITENDSRDEMVQHVYDTTYGTIRPGEDTLVVIDDSIVRGTTLKESIIKMLDRLHPKRIIVLSSAPQVRYPDCYGIVMNNIGEFVAFRAAVALLEERGEEHILENTFGMCKELTKAGTLEAQNTVRHIYKLFSVEEISQKISELVTPKGTQAQVDIIYQSIENLHESCPDSLGDWYFTGKYPTPGGNEVVNRAFMRFMEKREKKRRKNPKAYR